MGKRIVFGSFIVVLLVLLSATSAVATPRQGNGNNGTPPGQTRRTGGAALSGPGNSHAPQNASRGMNRPGSPGSWKANGHSPAQGSFPQGHSPSDPDFTGNGGLDKPGQTGGFSADRDGNNGCGNDSDREDDNNGRCGRKPHNVSSPPVTQPSPGRGPRVLPLPKFTRVEAETLPKTGIDALDLSYAGLGLMIAGQMLRRRTRRRAR